MANGGRIDYSIGFNVDKTGLNQIKSSLQEIKNLTAQDLMKIGGHTDIQKAEQELKSLKASISQIDGALEKAFNTDLGTLNVSKFNQALKGMNLNQVYKDFSAAGAAGQSAFRNVTSQILTTNMQLKQTHNFLNNMATTMANTVKWGVASSVMNSFTGSVQKAYGYVKSLDTSLNDIRIVTGASADEMERFAVKANNAAKELGKSTTDYTEAALIYYQQGLSDEDVAARAETTLKAANVTGQSGQAVSEQLTAVWNGYKVSAEEAELYIDKLAAVAATTAADLEELSTGMSKVASAADLMGVDIDQLNAQMATIVSVTRQAPESVGTALKTIYARMGDIEAGLDADTTLGHYTEEMKAMGVNVLDANGKLRDMGSVIEEIGGNWKNMTREQQISLSQTMAGTRQYNNLLSLFDNWDMYTDALNTSANAAGTLQKQQDTYMESTQAHLNQLRAASEDLYDSLLDPKGLNPLIDGLTAVTNLFANFVDSIGGGGGVLLALGSIGTKVFSQQLASGISTFVVNLQNAKENARQLQAELELTQQFGSLDKLDPRTKNLVEMKEKILQLNEYTSEEEKNIANEIIRQTNELYKQQDLLKEQQANAYDTYERLTGVSLKDGKGEYRNLSAEERDVAKRDLQTEKDELKGLMSTVGEMEKYSKLQAEINTYKNREKSLTEEINALETVDSQKNQEQIASLKQQLDYTKQIRAEKEKESARKANPEEQIEALKEKIGNSYFSQEVTNQLDSAFTVFYDKTQNLGKGTQAYENQVRALAETIRRTLGVSIDEVDQAIKELGIDFKGESNKIDAEIDALKGSFGEFTSTIDLKKSISNVITLTSAVGQAASAITTITRLPSIWKNEDLTSGEKLLQTLTNMGFVIPQLAGVFSSLNKALQGNAAAQEFINKISLKSISYSNLQTLSETQLAFAIEIKEKVQAGEMTVEAASQALKKKGIAHNIAYKLSFDKLAQSIGISKAALFGWGAAIGIAVIGAIALFKSEMEKAEKASEALNESISELDSATSELENLESSLQGVQDKLDELYSKGELSITDKEDITNLERERIELETQLALQKEINAEKQKGVVSDAKQALNAGSFDNGSKYMVQEGGFKGESIDVATEETKDAWIEEQVSKKGEKYRERITEIADSYYDKYHSDFVTAMTEDLEVMKTSLEAALATGDTDLAEALQTKITESYESLGMLDDTVLSSMDSVFQGDTAQQNQFHDALQSGDPTGGKWTDEDLAKAGLAESQIEALKVAADAAGISLDTLVNTYKELGNEEIAGTFENNINKIKMGVEGEDQEFNQEEAEGVITDLQKQYGVDDDFINRSLEKVDFSKIDYTNFAESLKAAMEQAMAEQSQEDNELRKQSFDQKSTDIATEFDFDEDAYKDLVEHLSESAKANDELHDSLEENGEVAQEVAKDLMRYDKACEAVKDSSEDWLDALENGNIQDQSEAISEMADAYGDMLDIDGSALSNDFLTNTENLKLMQQAANGSEEAYNSLQEAAAKDILVQCGMDTTQFEADKAWLNSVVVDDTAFPDLEVGASLNDVAFLSELSNLVNQAGMTAEQATSYLSSMGIDAEVEEHATEGTETSEYTGAEAQVTTEPVTYINPLTGEEETSNVPSITYTEKPMTVTSNKENKAFSLEVTSATKSSGGGFKHKNSSHGGGSKGKSKGKSGGGKGGGGKKSSEKKVKTEKDRYHDVNVKLKQIDKELEDIGKDQEKYFGKDLIKALNKELDILEKQKKVYKDKLKIAKEEQKELQKSLKSDGVKFNKDGTIANYEKALQAQENALNKLIDKYNKLPAKKQEKFKETVLDPAKEEFEQFKENIERYDEVLLEEIPEIEDNLKKALDREIEINVQKLKMEVELRLDLSEAQKDWNEFQREVLDGIDSDDILRNAQADKNLYETLLSNGTLGAETNKIGNIAKAINDINTKGTSDIYGDNKALAMEDLKAAMDELMGSMTDLNELKKNIDEAYLDMIDEMGEAFDNQAESLEYVNELLEHNINLTELIHGEDAYAEMAHHYEDIVANNLKIIAANQEAAAFYKDKMKTETDPEAAKKWKELWKDAIADLNASVEDSIQTINDRYMNSIDLAFEKMKAKFAGDEGKIGDKSFGYYSLEWELANEEAEKYLGAMDKAYELQKLQNKYKKSIDETSSVKAQRELNKLMDEEMKKLREKDKLTQYDIDRANAKYELRLKEIALEEAQQNKSQMRLRRDSSGNYSYQFIADEQAVADAQQEVADATHSLFEMDQDEMNQKGQEYLDTLREWNERLKEVDIDDHEARALINKEYQERLSNLKEDYLAIEQNLIESAFMDRALLYDEDIATYQAMADAEREILMNQMVPTWDTGVRQMMNTMAGPEGLGPACEKVLEDLNTATDAYNESLAAIETTAKTTFDYTKEQYDANVLAAKDLVTEAQNLVTETEKELTAVTNLKTEVDNLATSYATVFKNATDALTAAQALWEAEEKKAAEEAAKNNPDPNQGGGGGKTPADNGKKENGDGGQTSTDNGKKEDKTLKKGDRVTYESGKYYYTSAGDSPTGTKKRGKKVYITKIKKGAKYPIHISTGSSLGDGDLGWLKEKQLKFDTGGYTGDWAGNDGKTAILHKKELVLNAKDTENILATVNIVRDMQTMINSLNDSIISRTSGMMNSIGSNLDLNTTVGTDLNQQVSIQASFPGVSSRAEIEQAFENLVNMASQHAYNTRR